MYTTQHFFNLAKLAYETPSPGKTTEEIFENVPNLRDVYSFDAYTLGAGSDAQYYGLVFDDSIVYAMRGTSSMYDTLADSRFYLREFDDIKEAKNGTSVRVHSGFLSQHTSIKASITSSLICRAMTKDGSSRKRVIFVGHSLGGALATLAAASTKARYPQLFVECITFGSPRVGNVAFSAFFDTIMNRSVRCVNANDKVTKNPSLFYSHVGGEFRIGDQSPSWFLSFFGSVADHRLDGYEKALQDDTKKSESKNLGIKDMFIREGK
jgi:hypothetical protein